MMRALSVSWLARVLRVVVMLVAFAFVASAVSAQPKAGRHGRRTKTAQASSTKKSAKKAKKKRTRRGKRAQEAETPSTAAATEEPATGESDERSVTGGSDAAPDRGRAIRSDVVNSREVEEGGTKVKVMEFSGLDVSGRLKSPQILYFLNRMRAEFDRPRLDHRSFMPELVGSAKEKSF